MKKNLKNAHWFELKGYDRVRAIFKLRKSINKFGDKLGKKNHILNIILKNNITNNKFIDLNITRFYPEAKPINFSNYLIKQSNNVQFYEEKKNSNIYSTEEKSTTYQTNEIITNNIIKNNDNSNRNDKFYNVSKEKVKSYISKTKIDKKFSCINKERKKSFIKKISIDYKNDTKNFNFFQPLQKERKNSIFFNSSSSDIHSNNISPRYNNNNINNTITINLKKYVNKQENNIYKTALNNSTLNMSLFNKNIIPKIKFIKINSKKILDKFKKSYSTSNINKINIKSRNISNKIYNNKAQKKKESTKYKTISVESNINHINLSRNSEKNIDGNIKSKGMNKLMTKTFKFFKRKKMPSYLNLPKINKISFPKDEFYSGNNYKINNGSFDHYIILKDEKNQVINKILTNDKFNSLI